MIRRVSSACPDEVRQMVISLAVTYGAFIVVFYGIYPIYIIAVAVLIAVGTGFMGHELMHRYVARRLGYIACYRMWPLGLVMLALTSVVKVPMGIAGAVHIGYRTRSSKPSQRDPALISAAGPLANVVFSSMFLALYMYLWRSPALYIPYAVNAWLGLMNMIPVPPLDGFKVIHEREYGLWTITIVAAALLSIPYLQSII